MLERAFWYSVFLGISLSAFLAVFRNVRPDQNGLQDRFLFFLLRYGLPAAALQFVFVWIYALFFS
jgi:hypothetical protein